MKRRSILSMILASLILANCIPALATNNAETSYEEGVWVGGVRVTERNQNDVLGDGTVKYNPETNTLTLTDATISNGSGHGIYAYGVNLTINGVDTKAKGNNSISGKCVIEKGIDEEGLEYTTTESGCAIFVEGNGFEGNGSLEINGVLGDIYGDAGYAIRASKDIEISATMGDISCTGDLACGIGSDFGYVLIKETALIDDIKSEEHNGISAETDIIISGKAQRITGGNVGISTSGGDVYINGNAESIIGEVGGIEAYQRIDWDENGNEVYIGGGVAISGTAGKVQGGAFGIKTDASLNMRGLAEVRVTDTDGLAISVGGDIILDKSIVTKPQTYIIGKVLVNSCENEECKEEIWHNTLLEGDGKPAQILKVRGMNKRQFLDNLMRSIASKAESILSAIKKIFGFEL